jgi:hypothetical protein
MRMRVGREFEDERGQRPRKRHRWFPQPEEDLVCVVNWHLEDLRTRRPQPVTKSGASGNKYNYSISGAHQYHGPGAACSIR